MAGPRVCPQLKQGLDSLADYAEGDFGDRRGEVLWLLRELLGDALGPQTALVEQGSSPPARLKPAPIDTAFQPVALGEQLPTPSRTAIAREVPLAAAKAPEQLDLSVLQKVLGGREGSRVVERYLAAVEGNLRAGNLKEASVAALIEQGLRAHYAVLRAEITGGSLSTGIGVAIKKWSRPAALGLAVLVEFVAGVFGIGMLVGETYGVATAGLSFVQSILFGLGLSQVSKPGFEKKTAVALLAAWSAGVTLLLANNPELKHLAQTNVFQLERPAQDALVRLKRARMRQARIENDLAQSREHRRGIEGQGRTSRAVVSNAKAEVTEAMARRDSADDEIAEAERELAEKLAKDPSEKWAILALALLFGSASMGSGIYFGRYVEGAEEDHARSVQSNRAAAEFKVLLAGIRDNPEAYAAELFGVLKGLYVDLLQATGMNAGTAQTTAEREFGDGEAIRMAAARYAGKKYRPPKAARDARLG